jgi:L-asparaginase
MAHHKIRKLLVITTGGTIAGEVATTASQAHSAKNHPSLLESLAPTLADISQNSKQFDEIQVDTDNVASLDSSDIKPSDWVNIIDSVAKQYGKYDGFIVTHGTNTMGYTSAALSFALENLGKPVVVTGSQVPFGWPGSDAVMNLENALRVATWDEKPGPARGVICVFGSHIITGTRTKKSTEFDYDAFQSFSTASLGRIGRVIRWNVSNLDRHHRYLSKSAPEARGGHPLRVTRTFDPRVLSFTEFPGMDSETFQRLAEHLIDQDLMRGILFRAFGAGDVSTYLHPAFQYLKDRKIPIVVTTQAPNGNSNFAVNEPGLLLAKHKLAIPAYDMSIESMTTKLMWLLGQNLGYDEITDRMLDDLHGEVSPEEDRRG